MYFLSELLARVSFLNQVLLFHTILKQGPLLDLRIKVSQRQAQDILDSHTSIVKYEIIMQWIEKVEPFFTEQLQLLKNSWPALKYDIRQSTERTIRYSHGRRTPNRNAESYGWNDMALSVLDGNQDGYEESYAHITPLIAAILGHSHHAVSTLIEAGASVHGAQLSLAAAEDMTGTVFSPLTFQDLVEGHVLLTPLMVALMIRDAESLKLLIKAGAKADGLQGLHCTPLTYAVRGKLQEEAIILLELGAFTGNSLNYSIDGLSLLSTAIHNGLDEVALQMLEKKADPDFGGTPEGSTEDSTQGSTKVSNLIPYISVTPSPPPLLIAASRGNSAMANALIAAGATLDECWDWEVPSALFRRLRLPEHSGITALHTATLYGHEEIVRSLLNAGADTQMVTLRLANALFFAILGEQAEVAMMLIEHEAQSKKSKNLLPYAREWVYSLCSASKENHDDRDALNRRVKYLGNKCRCFDWKNEAYEIKKFRDAQIPRSRGKS